MATCNKCGAANPEDSLFCIECGELIEETEEKKKRTLKGLFRGGKKKDKTPEISDSDPLDAIDDLDLKGESSIPDDLLEKDEKTYDSIEEEAQDWAGGVEPPVIDEKDMDFPDDPSVITAEETKDHLPEKRVVPKAVFIPRNKNGAADKSFGILILAVILGIITVAFVFAPSMLNFNKLLSSSVPFIPVFLIALGGLIIARTGNIDFSLPGIAIVTYFLLMQGFNGANFYLMLLVCVGGAFLVGLVSGMFVTVGKVPAVFTGLVVLVLSLTYVSTILSGDSTLTAVPYNKFTKEYLTVALVILSVLAAFILIYLSRLGKPIYKRKGLTGKNKLLYVLSFALAYLLAVGAGAFASFFSTIPTDTASVMFISFDYIIGMLFIVSICGMSTLFDNRVMPVFLCILGFLAWFGIDIIVTSSKFGLSENLAITGVKVAFLVLALIGERVYTKAHLADFYKTLNVKK